MEELSSAEVEGSWSPPVWTSRGSPKALGQPLATRPWLKFRSLSVPEPNPPDPPDQTSLMGQISDMACFPHPKCNSERSINPPVARAQSLPHPRNVTSRGVLMEHVYRPQRAEQRDPPRSAPPYQRSMSESGTRGTSTTLPLRFDYSTVSLSGLVSSVTRRLGRFLSLREDLYPTEPAQDGRTTRSTDRLNIARSTLFLHPHSSLPLFYRLRPLINLFGLMSRQYLKN